MQDLGFECLGCLKTFRLAQHSSLCVDLKTLGHGLIKARDDLGACALGRAYML